MEENDHLYCKMLLLGNDQIQPQHQVSSQSKQLMPFNTMPSLNSNTMGMQGPDTEYLSYINHDA